METVSNERGLHEMEVRAAGSRRGFMKLVNDMKLRKQIPSQSVSFFAVPPRSALHRRLKGRLRILGQHKYYGEGRGASR